MLSVAFHGDTALRFLYGVPRYSEDLDFSLENPQHRFKLRDVLPRVRTDLAAEGYDVSLKIKDSSPVHSGFVKIGGLLHELGLSTLPAQVLKVKIEVDTNPPAGARLETTLIRRFVTLRLTHHDRSSMLAGKLHAVLQRSWTKGRDLYDLLWYLSDPEWPEPNLVLLNNALIQSGWTGNALSSESWRQVIREKVQRLDWTRVVTDVQPFLEPGSGIVMLTVENLLQVLSHRPR
jgi:predicted nucleotidyltransferase component of viral defense system